MPWKWWVGHHQQTYQLALQRVRKRKEEKGEEEKRRKRKEEEGPVLCKDKESYIEEVCLVCELILPPISSSVPYTSRVQFLTYNPLLELQEMMSHEVFK